MNPEQYDVVVLGTGPAGLQAAIHAARSKVSVLVIGRKLKSSLYRAHVENYCCLGKISGEDLLLRGMDQAVPRARNFSTRTFGNRPDQDGFRVRHRKRTVPQDPQPGPGHGRHPQPAGGSGREGILGEGGQLLRRLRCGLF